MNRIVKGSKRTTRQLQISGAIDWPIPVVSLQNYRMSANNKRPRPAEDEHPQKSRRSDSNVTAPLDSEPTSIATLLDFAALTSHSDINIRFAQLADALLCGHYLLLKHEGLEHEFDILELEFYLQKSGCHEDPFTHGAEEQRYCGRWCVATMFSLASTIPT